MEHINQLRKWDDQAKAAGSSAAADMDVAKRLLAHGIEAVREIERLSAFDVRKILIDIQPGDDGMGHEVYARSIDDVEKLISELSLKLEDQQSANIAVRSHQHDLLNALRVVMRYPGIREYLGSEVSGIADAAISKNVAASLNQSPDWDDDERRCGGPGCDGNCCKPADLQPDIDPAAFRAMLTGAPKTAAATAPATASYPCGSLGEEVESEGGAA